MTEQKGPTRVEVINARECQGNASDGSGRLILLIVIAILLFWNAAEQRGANAMYVAVHGESAKKAYQPTQDLISSFASLFYSNKEKNQK